MEPNAQPALAELIAGCFGEPSASASLGAPANRPDIHGDLPGVPGALGRALATVHGLAMTKSDVAEPPASDTWSAVCTRIERRHEASEITPSELPEPYSRYSADDLVKMFVEGRPERRREAVVCVGLAVMSNTLMNEGAVTGFADLHEACVADPHLDLAAMHHSIHHGLGPEAVYGFYESYGGDPDVVLLDHYMLASHLLGHRG